MSTERGGGDHMSTLFRLYDERFRTWETEGDGFRVGIWDQDEWAAAWHSVPKPPHPWRHQPVPTLLHFLNPDGRSVLVTGAVKADGKPWLHVSVARQNRMPSYKDLKEVKALFVGSRLRAIQVFPPESEHVNIHQYALHLWACLEDDGLPDFTMGMGTI